MRREPVLLGGEKGKVLETRQQPSAQYHGYRSAGIRLSEEPLVGSHSHGSEEISSRLYAIHTFDKAHLVMLVEAGLLPVEYGASMLSALLEMDEAGVEHARIRADGGIHSGEQYLVRLLGEEIGGRIHLGRSSGDLNGVSYRIVWRDRILLLLEGLNVLRAELFRRAHEHVATVMPGYSQAQHGQPTTYGHELLSWAVASARDFQRLAGAYERINQSPAGAAIMTGSSFPLNRHRTAELLGFDAPLANTFDAIMSHDVLLELHSVLAIIHANLLRWAEDIMLWRLNEVDLIDLPDRFCGTSSIMMQKKNALTPQDIKGGAVSSIGSVVTAFLVEKGPTGTAMIDRHASTGGALASLDEATRSVSWMVEMVKYMEPKAEVMQGRAGEYWAQATDLGALLVTDRDLPWRTAHQIVGILVRLAEQRGLSPSETTSSLLDQAAIEYFGRPLEIEEGRYRQALDPVRFVTSRSLYGGPAPDESRRRLAELEAELKFDASTVVRRQTVLKEASERLDRAVQAIITEGDRI